MDPFYFLDIELEETKDNYDLSEYTSYIPDGSWFIYPEGYKIIYKTKEYTAVGFDNNTKFISFYDDNEKIILKYKLVLQEIEL